MIRIVTIAFGLALVSSAQAMPLSRLQPDDTLIMVRQMCGVGYQRVAGRCVRNTTVRQVRRCARGYRWVNGRCII